jgi:hypothetical protein
MASGEEEDEYAHMWQVSSKQVLLGETNNLPRALSLAFQHIPAQMYIGMLSHSMAQHASQSHVVDLFKGLLLRLEHILPLGCACGSVCAAVCARIESVAIGSTRNATGGDADFSAAAVKHLRDCRVHSVAARHAYGGDGANFSPKSDATQAELQAVIKWLGATDEIAASASTADHHLYNYMFPAVTDAAARADLHIFAVACAARMLQRRLGLLTTATLSLVNSALHGHDNPQHTAAVDAGHSLDGLKALRGALAPYLRPAGASDSGSGSAGVTAPAAAPASAASKSQSKKSKQQRALVPPLSSVVPPPPSVPPTLPERHGPDLTRDGLALTNAGGSTRRGITSSTSGTGTALIAEKSASPAPVEVEVSSQLLAVLPASINVKSIAAHSPRSSQYGSVTALFDAWHMAFTATPSSVNDAHAKPLGSPGAAVQRVTGARAGGLTATSVLRTLADAWTDVTQQTTVHCQRVLAATTLPVNVGTSLDLRPVVDFDDAANGLRYRAVVTVNPSAATTANSVAEVTTPRPYGHDGSMDWYPRSVHTARSVIEALNGGTGASTSTGTVGGDAGSQQATSTQHADPSLAYLTDGFNNVRDHIAQTTSGSLALFSFDPRRDVAGYDEFVHMLLPKYNNAKRFAAPQGIECDESTENAIDRFYQVVAEFRSAVDTHIKAAALTNTTDVSASPPAVASTTGHGRDVDAPCPTTQPSPLPQPWMRALATYRDIKTRLEPPADHSRKSKHRSETVTRLQGQDITGPTDGLASDPHQAGEVVDLLLSCVTELTGSVMSTVSVRSDVSHHSVQTPQVASLPPTTVNPVPAVRQLYVAVFYWFIVNVYSPLHSGGAAQALASAHSHESAPSATTTIAAAATVPILDGADVFDAQRATLTRILNAWLKFEQYNPPAAHTGPTTSLNYYTLVLQLLHQLDVSDLRFFVGHVRVYLWTTMHHIDNLVVEGIARTVRTIFDRAVGFRVALTRHDAAQQQSSTSKAQMKSVASSAPTSKKTTTKRVAFAPGPSGRRDKSDARNASGDKGTGVTTPATTPVEDVKGVKDIKGKRRRPNATTSAAAASTPHTSTPPPPPPPPPPSSMSVRPAAPDHQQLCAYLQMSIAAASGCGCARDTRHICDFDAADVGPILIPSDVPDSEEPAHALVLKQDAPERKQIVTDNIAPISNDVSVAAVQLPKTPRAHGRASGKQDASESGTKARTQSRRPNYFISVRLDTPAVLENAIAYQTQVRVCMCLWHTFRPALHLMLGVCPSPLLCIFYIFVLSVQLLASFPSLTPHLLPPGRDLHLTLNLLALYSPDEVARAAQVLKACEATVKDILRSNGAAGDHVVSVQLRGVDHFSRRVLYAKPTRTESFLRLERVVAYLSDTFAQAGLLYSEDRTPSSPRKSTANQHDPSVKSVADAIAAAVAKNKKGKVSGGSGQCGDSVSEDDGHSDNDRGEVEDGSAVASAAQAPSSTSGSTDAMTVPVPQGWMPHATLFKIKRPQGKASRKPATKARHTDSTEPSASATATANNSGARTTAPVAVSISSFPAEAVKLLTDFEFGTAQVTSIQLSEMARRDEVGIHTINCSLTAFTS